MRESFQVGKGVREEDNFFVGKGIFNGMIEKGKVQGLKIIYEEGRLQLLELLWRENGCGQ